MYANCNIILHKLKQYANFIILFSLLITQYISTTSTEKNKEQNTVVYIYRV